MKLAWGAKAMGIGLLVALGGYAVHQLLNERIGFGLIVIGWVIAAVGFFGHLSQPKSE